MFWINTNNDEKIFICSSIKKEAKYDKYSRRRNKKCQLKNDDDCNWLFIDL